MSRELPTRGGILAYGSVAAAVVTTAPLVLSQVIHLDKRHIAAYFVLSAITGTLANLVAGHLSDRRTPRYLVVAAAAGISTTGYVVLALSTCPALAYLAASFGSSSLVIFSQLFAIAKTRILTSWPLQELTIGMTTLRTLFTLGYVTGTLAASLLDGPVPLPTIRLLLAAGLFLIAGSAACTICWIERRGGSPLDNDAGAARSAQSTPIPFSLSCLLAPLAAMLLLQGADATRNVYLPLVELHLFRDPRVAPRMFSISAAAELLTTTAVGYGALRIGVARSISIAALFGVATSYVYRLAPDRVGIGGALFLATFTGGSVFGALSPLVVQGYSPRVFLVPSALCLLGSLLMLSTRVNCSRRVDARRPAAKGMAAS